MQSPEATMKIVLTARDLDLFEALHECGFLTQPLIVEFIYGSDSVASRRLGKLEAAGYIRGQRERATEPYVWQPTFKAITALKTSGRLHADDLVHWSEKRARASMLHKRHEADVSRLWFLFRRRAAEHPGIAVEKCWSSAILWDRTRDRDGELYPIRPDRYLELSADGDFFQYFIEVDRRSKTLARVAKQLYGYSVYYSTGGFAAKYGVSFPGPSFRVLVTAVSETRRNNMLEAAIDEMYARNLRVGTMRAYAVYDDVVADPYGPVWITEAEVDALLRPLASSRRDIPLGRLGLPPAVRAALDPRLLQEPYVAQQRLSPTKTITTRDERLRDAIVAAAIDTGVIARHSILESSWTKKTGLKEGREREMAQESSEAIRAR